MARYLRTEGLQAMVQRAIDTVFLAGFSLLYAVAVFGFKYRKSDASVVFQEPDLREPSDA
jgi:hypothetical protein